MRRAACLAAALVAALFGVGAVTATAQGAPSTFMTGFADGPWAQNDNPNLWFDRAVAADGRFVVLSVDWGAIAPQPPSGDPTNPANPSYNWGDLDQTVRDATAHGLRVVLTVASVGGASWVDGPGRPSNVTPGTWDPNAAAFGAFATAVARRYSGRFNPGTGALPHVSYYQAWSEPNLSVHLMPQWVSVHGHWVAESPIIYRYLLNAFYAGVKSVDSSDQVIAVGTAPFGDPPGGQRVPPALFVRDLLCLGGNNSRLTLDHCPNPAHFDILDHHPYSAGGPWWPAFNSDDVSLPDMRKLARPLALAERTGRALPQGRKPLWVLEFSWDTRPPNHRGVPIAMWARWMEESFYVLWQEGVDALAWFQLRDQACTGSSCSVLVESGLYFAGGQPKPDIEAFRFPFVAEPAGPGRARLWGLAPTSGTVGVQRLSGGHWHKVASFKRGAHAIFTETIGAQPGQTFRATDGGDATLRWRLARNRCQPSSECNVFTS